VFTSGEIVHRTASWACDEHPSDGTCLAKPDAGGAHERHQGDQVGLDGEIVVGEEGWKLSEFEARSARAAR